MDYFGDYWTGIDITLDYPEDGWLEISYYYVSNTYYEQE